MYSFVKSAAALVVAATLLSACGHEKSGGGVALMDLTAVARATGQDEVIRLKADANRQEMMAQLQQTAAQLDQQILFAVAADQLQTHGHIVAVEAHGQ